MTTIYDALSALQTAVSAAVAGVVTNNLETVTLGGVATAGDVLTLTATSSGIAGSPLSVSYTVKSTDALLTIAAGLAKAINSSTALQNAGLRALAVAQQGIVQVYYPASLGVVWSSSLSDGATETVGLSGGPQSPVVGVGWPPVNALQNIARGGSMIAVYDRKVGRNTTRWSPYAYDQQIVDATLTSAISPPAIMPPSGSTQIMLGGTVTAGDAVSCILNVPKANAPNSTAAVVAVSESGDTPTTMATKLAELINADATLSTWVHAVATGVVVALTNLLTVPAKVQSFTGNGGTQTRELSRRESQLQIACWAQTQQARLALVTPITELLSSLQVDFGLVFADGTPARLECENDFPIEDDTLEDVYRHDFLLRVEFPITTQDQLFAVLAPIPAFAVDQT